MRFRAMMLAALALALAPAAAAGEDSAAPAPAPATASGRVWLKGDLHVHSRHSEDSSNHPIAAILAFAEAVGMDFLLISDHDNHVSGATAANTWTDPEFRSDRIVLLYGAEWTTHRGHANPISARPYDHQRLYDLRDARDVRIHALKRELGVHLSANHPAGDDAFSMSYDMVDSLEVWNSVLWARNKGSMMVWDDLLKSGRMITGRGGSDAHHGPVANPDMTNARQREATANNIGTPITWVLADARSGEAVVAALTKGRVAISANPIAPRVEFSADHDGDGTADMLPGDNQAWSGGAVQFRVGLIGGPDGAAPYTVTVVKNGAPFQTLTMPPRGAITFSDMPAPSERTYYRVEIRGSVPPYPQVPNATAVAGDMVALSNPLYFNFDPAF